MTATSAQFFPIKGVNSQNEVKRRVEQLEKRLRTQLELAQSSAGASSGSGPWGTADLGGDITTAGKALLDDANAAAQRTTLGLGTAATQPETAFASAAEAAKSVTVTCDFGSSFTDKAQAVVTGQAWVTANSEIVPQVKTPSGVDPDEVRLLDLRPVISDLVAGTGFTVTLYSEPEATGTYDVMCLGVA